MPTCDHPKSRNAKMCRACQLEWLKNDPEIAARRKAGIKRYMSDPANLEAVKQRFAEVVARDNADPERQKWRKEHGKRQYRDYLSRPDVLAKTLSPEVRAKAGRSRTETVLAWCPPEYRQTYHDLVHKKLMKAAEAREAIEVMIRADARRKIRAIEREQHERQRREIAQAY